MQRPLICFLLVWLAGGCAVFPRIARQPTVHNPFPQLSKVAVAPFFNLSTEPTLDGRQVALAYFDALQGIPGFEVVPMGVVEAKLLEYGLTLASADEARKAAQLLGVDALVVGAVTDFSPYYPPRIGMHVEWYSANPCYHPIPPGYGLPWGTPEADEIPPSLIFEAEMALAREQMRTQTPLYEQALLPLPPGAEDQEQPPSDDPVPSGKHTPSDSPNHSPNPSSPNPVQRVAGECPPGGEALGEPPSMSGLPPDWPDPRGFSPPLPQPVRPVCKESAEPVLQHTRTYNGNDQEITTALASYVYFRDDARYGGWQSYLQRSDDYIRFCCFHHIAEMLTARGGAGETRIVWRWPVSR